MKLQDITKHITNDLDLVEMYLDVGELFKDKNIPCTSLGNSELYHNDDKKIMNFAIKYHNKTIYKLTGSYFSYYAVAPLKTIKNLLSKEAHQLEQEGY